MINFTNQNLGEIMKIFIVKNYDELSKKAAEIFAEQLKKDVHSVIGLATGSTPEGMYEELAKMYNDGEIDFQNVSSFNLDEYYGLADEHEQSYHYFMNKHLFSKVNMKKENIHIPSGDVSNVEKTCEEYDQRIEEFGGIDIQILGIGVNGHIGFNEPSDRFTGETHVVNLTEDTIKANSRFFENEEDVPKKAVTMGMKPIMNAKRVLLLASGAQKADAIKNAILGPITPEVPASILQLHKDLIVIVDEAAGAKLK